MKEMFGFFLFTSMLSVRGATPCDWGTYGEHCNLTCPLNCHTNVDRQLRHCHQQTGRCSEGCIAGWYGDRCETRCSQNCLNDVCIRLNGQCHLGCKDNHTNTGDYCNVTKEIGPSDSDSDDQDSGLVSILVPLAVLIILVVAAVAGYFFLRHRRNRHRTNLNESCREEMALIDSPFKKGETSEVPHPDSVDQGPRGSSGNTGVMGKDALDREIAKTKEVFLETSIFWTVKDMLEKCGHVTMSGAAGGGKRSIAVMLGAHYQEQGFQLVHVVDVCRFKLSEYIGLEKDVCFIFHDILRTLDFSQDVSQLRDMLRDLRQCQGEDMDERETGERLRYKVYAIITTNMHNVKTGISQLEEQENIFFKGPSFLDLTDMSYTVEEKKEIFLQHCKNRQIALDVDKICQFEQTFLGFPQTCKLFFEFQNFQKYSERFFQAPFRYLREELLTILQGLNDKAAALIVMFLSDDDLNIHQVESQSDNQVLEAIFASVEDVVHISSRTAVAMAIRQFRGTFFTKGDITGFSHRTVYNACACALFDINPSFVLKHCRAQFLDEYVQGGQGDTTVVSKYEPRVYLSDLYTEALEERLADVIGSKGINQGKNGIKGRVQHWNHKQRITGQ
ncbi:uncharacterized protein LOC124127908 isoform X1 [Haliotis rufescens]|uniref:uncharacterized protein LOC124127908 isoform X1 n=1 Tax=Haliotis rufescens TaxID=6454 RepID=UPI001EB04FFE|nr:uncharacterized protein LOC124127908 isoform X1 [Haliotis rufescens]